MKNSHLLYKFRKIDKFAIDILVNKRLFLSPWTTLNDPHEAEMYIETETYDLHANPKSLEKLDKRIFEESFTGKDISSPRLCSLSNIWHSNLLWSHYTDGHTGMAIGLTLPVLENTETITIKYENKLPIIKNRLIEKIDVLEALAHKSEEWQYEEEVRLVTFDAKRQFIENIEIKEVIFGLRTSNEDMMLVYNILKNDAVTFFKTCRKPGFYQLNKSDIYHFNVKKERP